jgi:rubrerythrin
MYENEMKYCQSKYKQLKEEHQFKCTECEYSSKDINKMYEHYNKFKMTHFIAKFCVKNYNTIFERETPLKCPYCGKGSPKIAVLLKHVKNECDICSIFKSVQEAADGNE